MPQIYKVGGCVRDKILGVKTNDIDFTYVSDNPNQTITEGFIEMKLYLEENKFKIFLATQEMLTIRAKFPSDHKYKNMVADFVLARGEINFR